MAIDLINTFLQKGQNISSKEKNNVSQTSKGLPQNLQVMRAMKALQAGQTLRGEIISVKGDEIQLSILKDMIIDARLAQSMNLSAGMMMSFQVKSNNSQGISLVPLFMNTAVDPNALKALDMAGIPVNERTMEMVQTLMEKGMPIDKQSLQEVYREVNAFKEASVKDIISLHQMNLPVTEKNLNQFSLYQNNQHYLSETFSEIGKVIGEQIKNWVQNGNTESAREILGKLEQFFGSIKENVVVKTEETLQNQQEPARNILPGGENTGQEVSAKILVSEESLLQEQKETGVLKQQLPVENMVKNSEKVEEQEISKNDNNKKEAADVDLWKQLSEEISKGKDPDKVFQKFEKLWGKAIEKQWMLEPEMIEKKEKVQDFYEKLSQQLKQLETVLEQAVGNKHPISKALQNTSSNLDFMNQINQFQGYIQLPLKMTNQNANGELYVFTNKRNLTRQDGKVTALLHLDMEYLGKLDVYVALENQKVSTNFYLEKEEYLDFLEAHMEMLTSRLNKRGYACDIKTSLRREEDSQPVIKKMEQSNSSPLLLSMQAFDMRA